jgi:hypothetical protein
MRKNDGKLSGSVRGREKMLQNRVVFEKVLLNSKK